MGCRTKGNFWRLHSASAQAAAIICAGILNHGIANGFLEDDDEESFSFNQDNEEYCRVHCVRELLAYV